MVLSRFMNWIVNKRNVAQGGQDRPNVVWICADDFATRMCSAYNPASEATPNLRNLAREGLRFDRAFCTCPLSTPSRQSIWTGRYPRSIGVTLTPTPLPADEVTLPRVLRQHGYTAASFGKTHYYFPRRDEFDLCVDLPDYHRWLHRARRRPLPPSLETLGLWRPFFDPARTWLNSRHLPYPATDEEMAGTYYAREAAKFVKAHRSRAPYFVYVGFYETHSPFWFPMEYRDIFVKTDIDPNQMRSRKARSVPRVFRELTPKDKTGIVSSYATSARFMDKNVGLILDAIESAGHRNNTLVIFSSDHGYLLGEHGRFEKHCCFEPAIHSNLILRWPGKIDPGTNSNSIVLLFDIFPTVLDACGVSPSTSIQAKSLVPLFNSDHAAIRDHIVIEYSDNAEAAVRTDRWKLIYSAGNRLRSDGYELSPFLRCRPTIRLFDLEQDPDEVIDLSDDPAQSTIVEQLTELLVTHLMTTRRTQKPFPKGLDRTSFLAECLVPSDEELSSLSNAVRQL